MSFGMSEFSASGDPKVVPEALAEHVEKNHLQGQIRFDLYIGASSGVKSEDEEALSVSKWEAYKSESEQWKAEVCGHASLRVSA